LKLLARLIRWAPRLSQYLPSALTSNPQHAVRLTCAGQAAACGNGDRDRLRGEMKHDHNEERNAAEKARIFLHVLTPSMARTDEIVHRLRHAAGLADSASNQGFSSQRVLNDIRGEAGTALKGVVASLDTGQHPLTEAMIDRARTAVAKWLAALDAHARWGIQK
jgi:hypothetical protein